MNKADKEKIEKYKIKKVINNGIVKYEIWFTNDNGKWKLNNFTENYKKAQEYVNRYIELYFELPAETIYKLEIRKGKINE